MAITITCLRRAALLTFCVSGGPNFYPFRDSFTEPYNSINNQYTSCESESRSVVSDSLWPHGVYSPWNSPGQNTGVSGHSLLRGIFPPRGPNPGLLHCRQFLYQLSHQGSPKGQLEILLEFTGKFHLMSRLTVSALISSTNWVEWWCPEVCSLGVGWTAAFLLEASGQTLLACIS